MQLSVLTIIQQSIRAMKPPDWLRPQARPMAQWRACVALCVAALLCIPSFGLAAEADPEADPSAMIARGDRDGAIRSLDRAWQQIQTDLDTAGPTDYLRGIAQNYRQLGVRSKASSILSRLVTRAATANPEKLVILLNELGEVQGEAESYADARRTYTRLLGLTAPDAHARRLALLTSLLKAEVRSKDALSDVNDIASQFATHFARSDAGALCDVQLAFAGTLFRSKHALSQETLIRRLIESATAQGTPIDRIYGLGYLAHLEELSGQADRALELARSAALASVNDHPALSYRWLWQIGRLEAAAGRTEPALAAYRESISILQRIRSQLLQNGFQTFRERVLPVYNEFVLLLLETADGASNNSARQAALDEAQQVIERFNESEILDYFADDCIIPRSVASLSTVQPDTAIVYQFVLDSEVAVLARFPDGMHLFHSRMNRDNLVSLATEFRDLLSGQESEDEVREVAEELYAVLIAPLEPLLATHETSRIVFIASASLRTIPMAALHDGDDWLIQRFEIANTLGLSLTDASVATGSGGERFFGGLSESVSGFAALPGVETELDAVRKEFDGDVMLNTSFTADSAATRLATGNYVSVHLATHGVFEREVSSSFLLTYDGKLTLDKLQDTIGLRRYLGEPIDLLVLSACETAAGDEKAALGLAGVSLKAGARSTLASLWEISDNGTALLMTEFYRNLKAGQTKSAALRGAQLKLIEQQQFDHPNFWSPFVLIGGWL